MPDFLSVNHYPRSTKYLTAFLRRSLPHVRAWPEDSAMCWVQWHCDRGLALVVKDGWRIKAAVLLRRVFSRDEAESHYGHHPSGPIAYIDACVAREQGGMKPLFNLFYLAVGHACTHMAWARLKYSNRITVLKMQDAYRRLVYG